MTEGAVWQNRILFNYPNLGRFLATRRAKFTFAGVVDVFDVIAFGV